MSDTDPNLHPKTEVLSDEQRRVSSEELASIHQMIADLDQWAKQNEGRMREADEMHEKMFESKLPEVLFHATTKARAKRIMLEGLKPHQLEFEPDIVVSLSDTISFAKFCAGVTQNTTDLVVLEVTTQGLDREQAKSFLQLPNTIKPGEPLHEVHYYEPISADFIHQLSTHELAGLETEK